jgi:hypothetical protein
MSICQILNVMGQTLFTYALQVYTKLERTGSAVNLEEFRTAVSFCWM